MGIVVIKERRLTQLGAALLCVCACAVAAAAQEPAASAPPAALGAVSDALAVERAAALPRDLSVWGMFVATDAVVKTVMIGLALASVLTWTVAFAKAMEIVAARRRLAGAQRKLAQAASLAEAGDAVGDDARLRILIDAASDELRLSADLSDKAGIKERVASRLARLEAQVARVMARGTGALATIGATAPFIGLFGTVWGIMNSFIGISKAQTTNLAVVAPGIAEALLATALGLIAAVPAVIVYNVCARGLTGYRALYADAAAEVLRLVSRDLDRGEQRSVAGGRRIGRA